MEIFFLTRLGTWSASYLLLWAGNVRRLACSFSPTRKRAPSNLPHCHSPTKMSVIDLKMGGWLVGWFWVVGRFIRAGQSVSFCFSLARPAMGHQASSRPSFSPIVTIPCVGTHNPKVPPHTVTSGTIAGQTRYHLYRMSNLMK